MSNPNKADLDRFAWRIDELRYEVSRRDPFTLASSTGALYEEQGGGLGAFKFRFWGEETRLSFPNLVAFEDQSGKELPLIHQAMLLYYFRSADGSPVRGHWISFSELPDGRFYNQAFQGYTGLELLRFFQDDQTLFEHAAIGLNGERQSIGNVSFSFKVLPRISLLVVFWLGDEDFSSSFQMLFDSSASHYLPTDGYAILGSTLSRKLIKSAG